MLRLGFFRPRQSEYTIARRCKRHPPEVNFGEMAVRRRYKKEKAETARP